MVRHGGTCALDLSGAGLSPSIFLGLFFYFAGDVSLRTGPPTPLEWLSFPPLIAAVLFIPKSAESPGSGRVGVIGALVFFSI